MIGNVAFLAVGSVLGRCRELPMMTLGEVAAVGFGCLLVGVFTTWSFMKEELRLTTLERDELLERVAKRVVEESSGCKP